VQIVIFFFLPTLFLCPPEVSITGVAAGDVTGLERALTIQHSVIRVIGVRVKVAVGSTFL